MSTESSAHTPSQELATLGAGCFWCVEAVFEQLRGDQVWKGMLQIPLQSDDDAARGILANMNAGG